MLETIPLDAPADLEELENFLGSDRAPPDCMELSELDGFLAGIVVGPELIPPSEWLPHVWRCDEQIFADAAEAQTILAIILRRYNEIADGVRSMPVTFRPVVVEGDDGKMDASDWAVGFVQAMSLRQDGWTTLMLDPMAATLIAPIMLIASMTEMADLHLDADERLPDAEMAKLMDGAEPLLGICLSGIHAFFQQHRQPRTRKPTGRRKRR
jgi:uncharacterized protein